MKIWNNRKGSHCFIYSYTVFCKNYSWYYHCTIYMRRRYFKYSCMSSMNFFFCLTFFKISYACGKVRDAFKQACFALTCTFMQPALMPWYCPFMDISWEIWAWLVSDFYNFASFYIWWRKVIVCTVTEYLFYLFYLIETLRHIGQDDKSTGSQIRRLYHSFTI